MQMLQMERVLKSRGLCSVPVPAEVLGKMWNSNFRVRGRKRQELLTEKSKL